jgi:predicted transcriptional regulator
MAQKLAALERNPAHYPKPLEIRSSVRKPTRTRPQTYVSLPQQERIRARHIAGESLSEIARKEGRHRATITKIVRSEEVAQFVAEQRAKLYGYVEAALSAVFSGLSAGDYEFAYQFLKDIGVVPSETERLAAQAPETTGSNSDGVKRQMEKAVMIMMERKQIYNTQFEEIEDLIGEKLLPLDYLTETKEESK